MRPDGKGPNMAGWLFLAFLLYSTYYRLHLKPKPSKEINYLEFVNLYLSKGLVTMITISENQGESSFKYRATLTTTEGQSYHLVLPQVEGFLYKLDQTQREMGKDPASFVPVKYGTGLDEVEAKYKFILVGLTAALLFLIIKNQHRAAKTHMKQQ